jgi:hypothetical protein
MQMQSANKARERIDMQVALQRINSIRTPLFIMGRDQDELQGIFRLSYELLAEQNKDVVWQSYDHDLHGFIFPLLGEDGNYVTNKVQELAIKDVLSFFGKHFLD